MLYDQCPLSFRERYIDGVALEPTEALCFGSAVHQGLESHYNGGDGERAFRAAWKAAAQELLNGEVDPTLTATGLDLLDQVFELDLHGVPEHGFSLDTNAELGAPIVGAIDLWDKQTGVVYDFKTTIGSWSQERAQREVWQPYLYTWAAYEDSDVWPVFEYIVLNRATKALTRFRREWTPDDYLVQLDDLWGRMRAISSAVAADALSCNGKHGYCPECGAKWAHDHVCASRLERVRLGRHETPASVG